MKLLFQTRDRQINACLKSSFTSTWNNSINVKMFSTLYDRWMCVCVSSSVIFQLSAGLTSVSSCPAGLQILYTLLQNVSAEEAAAQSFYQTYFCDVLQHIFSVVTDTSHTAGNVEALKTSSNIPKLQIHNILFDSDVKFAHICSQMGLLTVSLYKISFICLPSC